MTGMHPESEIPESAPSPVHGPVRPVIALTMGDVAGIGPEVVACAVASPEVQHCCRPLVVGDPEILLRACRLISSPMEVIPIGSPAERMESESRRSPDPGAESQGGAASTANCQQPLAETLVFCWNPTQADLRDVPPGAISAAAGQAAFDWLIAATDAALAGKVDAVVTAPLNKAALHAASHQYPGHTEILAERCGVTDFAMMLYLPTDDVIDLPYLSVKQSSGAHGLGVAHVTLHTSIASVPGLLSTEKVLEKIRLVQAFLSRLGCRSPRIGVCALNPHAGEEGLFGDEERRVIAPAIEQARSGGCHVTGPLPADTLLSRAVRGEYDGIVAMYHDQGHIALKLLGFQSAVNVTLGLPIVRTSPSHGTAFDIAWQGIADVSGMKAAIRIAAQLASVEAAQAALGAAKPPT